MKKSLLLLFALALSASAFAERFECVADTWIRETSKDWKDGEKKATIELNTGRFDGLFGFNYQLPAGMKVQSATLHLITERHKGKTIDIYGYDNDFAENTTWGAEESFIGAAGEATSNPIILGYVPAGQSGKALSDTGINDDMKSLDKWTNDIDVTNYLKSLSTTTTRVNFLLDNASAQECFYSKDNTGADAFKVSDGVYEAHFDAAELMPYLEVTFVEDSDSSTDTATSVADVHLRSDNGSGNNTNAMEIKKQESGTTFYGLLRFNLPAEVLDSNYELTGASLRLVCTQNKGDRWMNLYDYSNNFTESTNYNNELEYITAALANDSICTFQAQGQGTKSISDKGINESYRNVEAWTSRLDLTDYISGKIEENASSINLLLCKTNVHNDAMKFATKEADDINSHAEEAANYTFTFKKEDLVPQLTISYKKVGSSSIVETVIIDANAPVEYYDLQGIRVANPEHGIYIVRQGKEVKKVFINKK